MRSVVQLSQQSLGRVFRRLASVLILVLLHAPWSASPVGAGLPTSLKSDGAPSFQVDAPIFFDQQGARMDLAVVIYHPDLKFVEKPGAGYLAQLILRVKLARSGHLGLEAEEPFTVEVQEYKHTLAPLRFALLEMSRPVESGTWALTVTVEDVNAGVGFGQANSEARGVLSVPLPPAEGPYISDLEFCWGGPEGGILPNPERIYGVNQDTLIVYFELNRAAAGAHPYAVEIEDAFVGYAQSDTIAVQGGPARTAVDYRVPIGTFLEGAYTLRVAPLVEGGVAREGDFIVTWSMEHLVQTARNTEIEIELLFDGQDRERLMAMPRAAQISALNSFWASVDPTPGTAVNETYDAFQARVDYARRNYRDQAHPGPLSARGRTYIRYGPPAEIQVEVLPNSPDMLEEAIVKVHDMGQVDRYGTAVKEIVPLNRTRAEAYQDLQRFVPGSAGEQAAFELWIYNMDGDRLVDNDGPVWTEGSDLRFLFVDILGTGIYELEFSNYPFRKD